MQAKLAAARGGKEQEADAASCEEWFDADTGAAEPMHAKPEPNRTGMPDRLKAGIEALSGIDMSDVRVHANSPKPARLNALAYTQGNQIYMGPGQERHLAHEAWHAVQQKQERVRATGQMKIGVAVNADARMELEANSMGGRCESWGNVNYFQCAQRNGSKHHEAFNIMKPRKASLGSCYGSSVDQVSILEKDQYQIQKSFHNSNTNSICQLYTLTKIDYKDEKAELVRNYRKTNNLMSTEINVGSLTCNSINLVRVSDGRHRHCETLLIEGLIREWGGELGENMEWNTVVEKFSNLRRVKDKNKEDTTIELYTERKPCVTDEYLRPSCKKAMGHVLKDSDTVFWSVENSDQLANILDNISGIVEQPLEKRQKGPSP